MEEMKFIFISHSNVPNDAILCERLYAYLSDRGICCWMDRENMRSGDWKAQIYRKIIKASAFILVASENSLISDQVAWEVDNMLKEGRPLIPFVLDDFYLKSDERKGSIGYNLTDGRLQAVFCDRFESEAAAFEKLISYLPQDITKLENNPDDFVLDESGKILKRYAGNDNFVRIPDFVREIEEGAFKNNKTLTSVYIPSSVEKIGLRAFSGCSALDTVDGMEGVIEMGDEVLSGTQVTLGEKNLYALCGVAFGGVTEGEKLTLAPVRVVANDACYGCEEKELILPEGLEYIGERAFSLNYLLERVVFPSSLKKIGKDAFSGCPLKEVVFRGEVPQNAKEIFKTALITEDK